MDLYNEQIAAEVEQAYYRDPSNEATMIVFVIFFSR